MYHYAQQNSDVFSPRHELPRQTYLKDLYKTRDVKVHAWLTL